MIKPSKINLFALPSQTATLFWLITATLLGAVLIGSFDSGPIPMAWLPFALILLSLRGFLAHPDRDIRQNRLISMNDDFPLLQKNIEDDARRVGLRRIPRILIDKNRDADAIRAMGSFRRWYIVCNLPEAQSLETRLVDLPQSSSAHAELFHELYHFKTGDYWQLGYLEELFHTAFSLMLWVMGFFVGWTIVLALAKTAIAKFSPAAMVANLPPESRSMLEPLVLSAFPTEAELHSIGIDAGKIDFFAVVGFVVLISGPLILLTAILWWFYRARLWRMREFYADAGMVQTLGSTSAFEGLLDSNPISQEDKQVLPKFWVTRVMEALGEIRKQIQNRIGDKNFWPSFSKRLNALFFPQSIFYDWKETAKLLGSLVLMLEIFLMTPLTLFSIGKNPIHFVTLVVIVAASYFLLPHVVLGKRAWVEGLWVVLAINSIRTLWLFFTLIALWTLYFLSPDLFSFALYYSILTVAHQAVTVNFDPKPLEFLVQGSFNALAQISVILAIQGLSVLGLIFLFRRAGGWYAFFTTSQRFKWVVFGLNFAVLFFLLTVILPLSNAAMTDNLASLSEPLNVSMAILGILVVFGCAIWFFIQDRRYHQRCSNPECPEPKIKIAVSDLLGAVCPACEKPLYPWLAAHYED